MNQDAGKELLHLTVVLLTVALIMNVVMLRSMKAGHLFVEEDVEHLAGFYQRMEALESEVGSQR